MVTVQAGQVVHPGVYLSLRHVDLRVISGGESVLEGPAGAVYKQLPVVAVLLLGPIVGGMFAMALPLIIFVAVLRASFDYVRKVRTFEAGSEVRWGLYLGVTRPTFSYVAASGELLKGRAGTRYIRVPGILVVLGCPLIGLLYVLFFPALIVGALVVTLGRAMYDRVSGRGAATPDDEDEALL